VTSTARPLEWRLAARVLVVAAALSAGIAALWAVVLPVAWVIEREWTVLWPIANAVSAALFVWVTWRFVGAVRTGGRRAGWWFAAFYLTGAVWTVCAVPPFGIVVPLLYAPMFLGGLAVVVVALRLIRALRRGRVRR